MSGAPASRGWLLALCPLLLAVTGASGRGPSRVFGPRMDYDEWTPLGRGDPLKNDPTYDYVPPVLERVHYWMDPKEGSARRDNSVDAFVNFVESPLPVPPTMLVPPPYQPPPPPPPPPPPITTTPSSVPAAAAAALPPSSYSSLDPFHHFEDQPVVTNIHFEERPMVPGLHFESPVVSDVVFDGEPMAGTPQKKPLLGPVPLPLAEDSKQTTMGGVRPGLNAVLFENKPTAGKIHFNKPVTNTIRFEEKPTVNKVHPPVPLPTVNSTPKPATHSVSAMHSSPSTEIRFGNVPAMTSNVIGGSEMTRDPPPVARPVTPMSLMTPPPPPPTSSSLAMPPNLTTASVPRDDSISSLIKNLLHREMPTTMSTLTTDPLFSHYRQPASPVNGPPYLIIQGHSKVKTYGPSKPTSIHGIPVQSRNDIHVDSKSKNRPHRRTTRRAAASY